jgi:hypothetical protein
VNCWSCERESIRREAGPHSTVNESKYFDHHSLDLKPKPRNKMKYQRTFIEFKQDRLILL